MGVKKGHKWSKEVIQKRAQALKGRKVSEETRKKIGLANKGNIPWNKGKCLTEDDKRNKSISAKRVAQTIEGKRHLDKMRALSHSPSANEKRSKSLSEWNKKRYRDNPNLGKSITKKAHEKTRQMVIEGTHPFQDPEVQIKARKELFKKNYGGTWIEKKIGWLLKEMGLEGIKKPIPYGLDILGRPKYLFPDFVLPDHDLIIECDGEYWHQDKERQKRRDAVFFEHGYRVLHLTGTEILENLDDCRIQIENLTM